MEPQNNNPTPNPLEPMTPGNPPVPAPPAPINTNAPTPAPNPVAPPQAVNPAPVSPQQPMVSSQQPYVGGMTQPISALGPASPSRKKSLFLAVGGALLLIVVGLLVFMILSGKTGGVKLSKYANQEFNFEIMQPEGWEVDVENEEYYKSVNIDEPAADAKDTSDAALHYAGISINYENDASRYVEQTESKFFDDLKKNLQAAAAESQKDTDPKAEKAEVLEEEMITVDGYKAYKVKIKVTNYGYEENAVGYETMLAVFIDKDKNFTITTTAHESEKEFLNKVDAIVTSFDFK